MFPFPVAYGLQNHSTTVKRSCYLYFLLVCTLQGFMEPSNDDNLLEVVAVLGATQMVSRPVGSRNGMY